MKKLYLYIFVVLMFCNVGFAAINDVYYCEMDKTVKTTDKQVIEFENQKFKFKRNQNNLKFGSGGLFNNYETQVLKNSGEYFWGGSKWERFIYLNGKFVFSNLLNIDLENEDPRHQIRSIVATCELF